MVLHDFSIRKLCITIFVKDTGFAFSYLVDILNTLLPFYMGYTPVRIKSVIIFNSLLREKWDPAFRKDC